ncbi:unnamed protein product [Fraxinus pennsylvanica]|uniref:Uncharacterized protein n=1 Tax=Fraxinus pennsylvanica TaxID=56036 RepID=A0AAD2A7B6_9LAMI|nr:unnamed protein product [Fraxinus pennsylvanica]
MRNSILSVCLVVLNPNYYLGRRKKIAAVHAAEASSSSTNDSPAVDELVSEAVAKESVRDEVRSVDLADDGDEKKSDVEKSPEAAVEDVGVSVTDTEKVKLNGSAANRGKKGQLKSHAGDAWGKLLSQSSQVDLHFSLSLITYILIKLCFLWYQAVTITVAN